MKERQPQVGKPTEVNIATIEDTEKQSRINAGVVRLSEYLLGQTLNLTEDQVIRANPILEQIFKPGLRYRNSNILWLRFGIDGLGFKTRRQVGQILNLSYDQVRRKELQLLKRFGLKYPSKKKNELIEVISETNQVDPNWQIRYKAFVKSIEYGVATRRERYVNYSGILREGRHYYDEGVAVREQVNQADIYPEFNFENYLRDKQTRSTFRQTLLNNLGKEK